MNRRSFLRNLGVGVAAAVVAPSVVAALEPVCQTPPPVINAVIAQYSDYVNFSDLAIACAIDASVAETANQLAVQASMSLDAMQSQVFVYQSHPPSQVVNSETPSTTPSVDGSRISSRKG